MIEKKRGSAVCSIDHATGEIIWFEQNEDRLNYLGHGSREPEVSEGVYCAFSAAQKAIAWYHAIGGRTDFLGFGKTAPSIKGYNQSHELWTVSNVEYHPQVSDSKTKAVPA
jgi:hypothetical protein